MWELFKSSERKAREAEALAEYDNWLNGRMPWDAMPSCKTCMTMHISSEQCAVERHREFSRLVADAGFDDMYKGIATFREITVQMFSRNENYLSERAKVNTGEFLLQHRGEAIALRNIYAHLYDSRDTEPAEIEGIPVLAVLRDRPYCSVAAEAEEDLRSL